MKWRLWEITLILIGYFLAMSLAIVFVMVILTSFLGYYLRVMILINEYKEAIFEAVMIGCISVYLFIIMSLIIIKTIALDDYNKLIGQVDIASELHEEIKFESWEVVIIIIGYIIAVILAIYMAMIFFQAYRYPQMTFRISLGRDYALLDIILVGVTTSIMFIGASILTYRFSKLEDWEYHYRRIIRVQKKVKNLL